MNGLECLVSRSMGWHHITLRIGEWGGNKRLLESNLLPLYFERFEP
jgi:hypothetical protein